MAQHKYWKLEKRGPTFSCILYKYTVISLINLASPRKLILQKCVEFFQTLSKKRWNVTSSLASPAIFVKSFCLFKNPFLHLSLSEVPLIPLSSLCLCFLLFQTPLHVVSPRVLSVAGPFCSRWSTASHLCCLCGAVICLRAGFVGLPVWGQAWGALMMEIVFFCRCFSQILTGLQCCWIQGAMFTPSASTKEKSWETDWLCLLPYIL